jgi:hypothetical protein
MLLQTLSTRDFDELAGAFPRWDLRLRQLGRGPFRTIPVRPLPLVSNPRAEISDTVSREYSNYTAVPHLVNPPK